jgi:hypothetical protein
MVRQRFEVVGQWFALVARDGHQRHLGTLKYDLRAGSGLPERCRKDEKVPRFSFAFPAKFVLVAVNRPDRAIRIARAAGLTLKIAAT